MANFTEDQIKELETLFGLTRVETLPVCDGVVTRNCMVWWKSVTGPQLVRADENTHWYNIKHYPQFYQLAEPKVKHIVYEGQKYDV